MDRCLSAEEREDLEVSIGKRLSDLMTDEELLEFVRLLETGAGAGNWLKTNIPEYGDIVEEECKLWYNR